MWSLKANAPSRKSAAQGHPKQSKHSTHVTHQRKCDARQQTNRTSVIYRQSKSMRSNRFVAFLIHTILPFLLCLILSCFVFVLFLLSCSSGPLWRTPCPLGVHRSAPMCAKQDERPFLRGQDAQFFAQFSRGAVETSAHFLVEACRKGRSALSRGNSSSMERPRKEQMATQVRKDETKQKKKEQKKKTCASLSQLARAFVTTEK